MKKKKLVDGIDQYPKHAFYGEKFSISAVSITFRQIYMLI